VGLQLGGGFVDIVGESVGNAENIQHIENIVFIHSRVIVISRIEINEFSKLPITLGSKNFQGK
jgi:hypothetical protein